jgi:hypothetical protein
VKAGAEGVKLGGECAKLGGDRAKLGGERVKLGGDRVKLGAERVELVVLLGVLVATAVTAYQLTSAMGSGPPIAWAIAMFLPCVSIIVLLVLSSKAQSWCKRYGVKVGLLGPTKESIEELRRRLMTSHFD